MGNPDDTAAAIAAFDAQVDGATAAALIDCVERATEQAVAPALAQLEQLRRLVVPDPPRTHSGSVRLLKVVR